MGQAKQGGLSCTRLPSASLEARGPPGRVHSPSAWSPQSQAVPRPLCSWPCLGVFPFIRSSDALEGALADSIGTSQTLEVSEAYSQLPCRRKWSSLASPALRYRTRPNSQAGQVVPHLLAMMETTLAGISCPLKSAPPS